MWFAGTDGIRSRIGYAYSDDGILWNKMQTNFDFNPPEEREKVEPTVIYDEEENIYKMWYASYPAGIIRYATSEDKINWTEKTITGLDKSQYWEQGAMSPGTVIKIKEGNIYKYYLWYTATRDVWKIGVAYSTDGINWTQYNQNPISEANGKWEGNNINQPAVVKDRDTYYFWYHSSIAPYVNVNISFAKSSSPFGPLEKPPEENLAVIMDQSMDTKGIHRPTVIKINNVYHMWYSGFDGEKWSIGYATTGEFPSTLKPIVLIPGMFASWNSEAILEGKNPPREAWKMTPFVKDYQGLIETLKSVGYSDNINDPKQNLFIFNYDWRDRVEETASLLNQFLENTVKNKNPGKKIFIIGHSLGGLIGRTYIQNYGKDNIEQLITLGSPHSGAIQAYKAWEGGVVSDDNNWQRLALEIVLGINRKGFRTDKDVIREIAPVTHDLLPIFDFLKDKDNKTIPYDKNDWLNNLENSFPSIFDSFYSIYGENNSTPEWYKVIEPNLIESLLGLWQNGKPQETLYSSLGDGTVLSKSATRSADPAYLLNGINHRELISNQQSIQEIINQLNLTPPAIITPLPLNLFFLLSSLLFNHQQNSM